MNVRRILKVLGYVLIAEAVFMLFPLIVSLIYEEFFNLKAFGITISILAVLGIILVNIPVKRKNFFLKEGLAVAGLSWIVISIFGAIPFMISGAIPKFIDAFFETVSGFTTTGATVFSDVEILSKGILFWRALTHFMGGMGILVFLLAFLPSSEKSIHIYSAESTGTKALKVASKLKNATLYLYLIYIGFTLLEGILLCFDMPVFDAICHAFSTAGTGGFSTFNNSIAGQSSYVQVVITVFMFIFGINFSLYYLLILGKVKEFFKSEELRAFALIVVGAILIVSLKLLSVYDSFGKALQYGSFQVLSIISTTGFFSAEFTVWPSLCLGVLFIVMFIGSMGGSTGGGIKVSRVAIAYKMAIRDFKKTIRPNKVSLIKFDGRIIDEGEERGVRLFLVSYFGILLISTLLLSVFSGNIETNLTASLSMLSNVGPAFGEIGFSGYYGFLPNASKIILCIDMLIGRLEILPILVMLAPSAWRFK
ncbi:MAG: TrkH family potassium uptake protein [Clostridiales bacterium]|nr:TrkH family potassium uptake protein [Clostridiales bacterium]